jgi:hypothetical protein
MYNKQSSPSTDQDYSSHTASSSIDTKSSINEIHSVRQYSQSRINNDNYKENKQTLKPIIKRSKSGFTEVNIDNIDGYITPTFGQSEQDFDISDIDDAIYINNHDDDPTNMDEDSLESCEGVIEIKKKPAPPPPIIPKVKSGGICTALYLAQKQKQASIYKKTSPTFTHTRSNTLPNVIEAVKKEEQINKIYHKPSSSSQRSHSTDLFDKNPLNDISKLDRDSGFDEQDFRCERLHSSYDDNSSVSSIKSARSSISRSLSSDLNGQTYRENKAYELRLKALDYTRILNDQSSQDLRSNSRKNFNYTSTRTNDPISPTTHKYRKNSQSNFYLKYQQ